MACGPCTKTIAYATAAMRCGSAYFKPTAWCSPRLAATRAIRAGTIDPRLTTAGAPHDTITSTSSPSENVRAVSSRTSSPPDDRSHVRPAMYWREA